MAKEKVEMAEETKEELKKRKKLKKEILASAKKRYKKKLRKKILKVSALVVALFLINLYIILEIIFRDGGFTVSLDYENGKDPNLIIYESQENKEQKTYLRCEDIDFISDTTAEWIDDSVHTEAEGGSHHGKHILMYTFFVENIGKEPVNYWTTAIIDHQLKGTDEAVRFMLYKNSEPRKIYAKRAANGAPEPDTIPFKDDTTIMLESRIGIMPGEIDKYTFVVFFEGEDPECVNDLLDGEFEMHMTLTEEHITDPKLMEEILKNAPEAVIQKMNELKNPEQENLEPENEENNNS